LSPETCWADLKRLINGKIVVESCWLFTLLNKEELVSNTKYEWCINFFNTF
jgi:hypothetical protein